MTLQAHKYRRVWNAPLLRLWFLPVFAQWVSLFSPALSLSGNCVLSGGVWLHAPARDHRIFDSPQTARQNSHFWSSVSWGGGTSAVGSPVRVSTEILGLVGATWSNRDIWVSSTLLGIVAGWWVVTMVWTRFKVLGHFTVLPIIVSSMSQEILWKNLRISHWSTKQKHWNEKMEGLVSKDIYL